MNHKFLVISILTTSMSISNAASYQTNIQTLNSKREDPILTAIDENYVLVNYQNIDPLPTKRIDLRILDFSRISIEFHNRIISVADSSYDTIKYGSTAVYQPLNSDHTMIGRLDSCSDYDNLVLRTDETASNDRPVEYHPDISKLIVENFKWICIKDESLNQLAFNQKGSCLNEGAISFSDGTTYDLSNGIMEVDMIPENRRVTLSKLKYQFDTDLDAIQILLMECKEEEILHDTADDEKEKDQTTTFDEGSSVILIASISISTTVLVILIIVIVIIFILMKRISNQSNNTRNQINKENDEPKIERKQGMWDPDYDYDNDDPDPEIRPGVQKQYLTEGTPGFENESYHQESDYYEDYNKNEDSDGAPYGNYV